MKLQKIITMASSAVEIPFLAMERSLRASGCQLPIWVIPYNEKIFDLPKRFKMVESSRNYRFSRFK
jgi:hypothetical protein